MTTTGLPDTLDAVTKPRTDAPLDALLDLAPKGTLAEHLAWAHHLVEAALLDRALRAVKGGRTKAAALLGVREPYLQRLLRRHPKVARRYPVARGKPRR